MFEKFTSLDAGNFRQRYLNTYGFFRHEDRKKLLVKLNRIDQTVGFVDKDGIGYTLNPDSPSNIGFEFLPPKAGWHNANDGAWLVRRIPARQWSRGIGAANTQINTPSGQRCNVDFPILAQLYENNIPVPEALKRFKQPVPYTTGYVAVSEQFALSANSKVFCYDNAIGTFTEKDGKYRMDLDDPDLWRQELTDVFRRNNLEMEIV